VNRFAQLPSRVVCSINDLGGARIQVLSEDDGQTVCDDNDVVVDNDGERRRAEFGNVQEVGE